MPPESESDDPEDPKPIPDPDVGRRSGERFPSRKLIVTADSILYSPMVVITQ